MIDHRDACLKIRARALTLEVLNVTDSFSATSTGYARTSGSFLDDGFEVGQEVKGSGFTNAENNDPKVVTDVTALALTTEGIDVASGGERTLSGDAGTVVEGAASRSLIVGMPAGQETENFEIVPGQGVPWWREEYSPSPGERLTLNPNAMIETLVDYFITLFLPQNVGRNAAARYANALLALFAPSQIITLADAATTCRVRSDTTPWVGRFQQSDQPRGFLEVPITVPLRLWAVNAI